MNEWGYNINCMLARDLPLEKLGIEILPWDTHTHTYTLGTCKYILVPLLWKSTAIWPSCVFLFQPFIPPLLLQLLHTWRKVKSMAAEPSSHGSRSSQGTTSSEIHTGWSRDIWSNTEPFQLPAMSWNTENWQWSEIQGKMQPEQSLQDHSLVPDTFRSEQTPQHFSGTQLVPGAWLTICPSTSSCDASSSRTRCSGKARQWKSLCPCFEYGSLPANKWGTESRVLSLHGYNFFKLIDNQPEGTALQSDQSHRCLIYHLKL